MANRSSSPTISESILGSYKSKDDGSQKTAGMSQTAMNELIAKQIQPIWKAFGDAQSSSAKERAEMKVKIDELETEKKDLKNQVENLENRLENFTLNNAQLIDRVEKTEEENARLREMLNQMELSGQILELKKVKFC